MKYWIILVFSGVWIVLAPVAGFWGMLFGMIDGTCAHWTLSVTQVIWLISGPLYLIFGVMALVFYKDKKFKQAFVTVLLPIVVVLLQLLTYPILESPIRDCSLY